MDNESLLGGESKQRSSVIRDDRFSTRRQKQSMLRIFPWALNSCLALIVILLLTKIHPYSGPSEVYSPAHSAIEYETKVFTRSFGSQKSKYQGPPSDEVDANWIDLYDQHGVSRITKASAMQLPNKTVPIPGDPDHYIIGLEVFHQLHCLNHLRMLIWPDRYHQEIHNASPEDMEEHIDHLDHCVDNLRQALMCHADVHTLWWEWIPKEQKSMAHPDTTHTCRNFDKIKEWAVENRLRSFDAFFHVIDSE